MAFRRNLFLLLVGICQMSQVSSRLWWKFCPLTDLEVRTVATDGTGYFFLENEPDGRLLKDSGSELHIGETDEAHLRGTSELMDDSWVDAVSVQRDVQDMDVSNLITATVRRCECADTDTYIGTLYYCVTPYTHCAIPSSFRSQNIEPGCLDLEQKLKFVRGVWPVVAVSFIFMALCLCFTRAGRGVWHYMLGKVYPPWTGRQVDRILRDDPARMQQLLRRYCFRRRREMERQIDGAAGGAFPPLILFANNSVAQELPTSLALKTRKYSAVVESPSKGNEEANGHDNHHVVHDHDSDFGDDEATCAICFGPIVDGCRVGALPCDHVFHVECLKTWLAKRNVCPLCQVPNAAMPTYTPHMQDEEQEIPQEAVMEGAVDNEAMLAGGNAESGGERMETADVEEPVWRRRMVRLRAAANRSS